MKNSEIALLAGAGIVAWYFFLGPGKTNSLALNNTTQPQNLLNAGSAALPLQSSASGNPVSLPVPGASMQSQGASNPYATLAQQQTIFNWANTMKAADQAQFYATWGSMTQADINGLMDLIVNEWQGGQPVTPARTTFWNNWRTTYKIDI